MFLFESVQTKTNEPPEGAPAPSHITRLLDLTIEHEFPHHFLRRKHWAAGEKKGCSENNTTLSTLPQENPAPGRTFVRKISDSQRNTLRSGAMGREHNEIKRRREGRVRKTKESDNNES